MKRMGMKGKKVLTNWIVSYLIILSIPFAMICINYFYSMQIIGEEIYESNELIVDNLSSGVDEYLKEAYKFHNYLYYEEALKTLRGNGQKDSQFYYDALELKNRINTYVTHNSKISCMIFLPEMEYVFDTQTGNEARTYYNTYRMNTKGICEYEEWIEQLSGNYKNQFFVGNYYHQDTGEPCIVYANSMGGQEYQPVNIFISVPVSAISKLTEEIYEDSKFLVLLNDEIQAVWSSAGFQTVDKELNEIFKATSKEGKNSDYYIVKGASSVDRRISYCMLISREAYEAKQLHIRNVFCISLIVTLLVAFQVLNALLRRNYKPISELLNKITNNQKWDGNEYELIERAYAQQISEKKVLQEQLMTQEEVVRNNALLKMMKGRNNEKYEGLILNEKSRYYVLVGIMASTPSERHTENEEILLFAVDNIFSELMKETKHYKIEEGQSLFYLFLVDEDEKSWRSECLKKADYLNRIMSAWWKQGLFIAVSKTESDWQRISEQYHDIMEEFRDRKLLGSSAVTDINKKRQKLTSNQRIVQAIYEVIEKKYDDCNLNVSGIAAELGKTPKHISEIFKEETGESILYAINEKRIKKAEALLRSGQYKLAEISELTGYSNMNTFRRNFQQMTGISPSNYMNGKGENNDT